MRVFADVRGDEVVDRLVILVPGVVFVEVKATRFVQFH